MSEQRNLLVNNIWACQRYLAKDLAPRHQTKPESVCLRGEVHVAMAEAQPLSPEQPPLLCLPLDTRQCRRTDCYLHPTAVPAVLPKQLPEPRRHPGGGVDGPGWGRVCWAGWRWELQTNPFRVGSRSPASAVALGWPLPPERRVRSLPPPRPESDAKYSEYWQRARLL